MLITTIGLGLLFPAACGPENQFVPPPPPKVTVETPAVRDVPTYTKFTGKTEALDTVEIRSRVAGFLKSVEFEDGERVKAGDLLYVIEQEPFIAALNAATASLRSAIAERDLLGDRHAGWLAGLLNGSTEIPVRHGGETQMLRSARSWIAHLDDGRASRAVRLCLQLTDPDPSLDASTTAQEPWQLSFHLVTADDPPIMIDADRIWAPDSAGDSILSQVGGERDSVGLSALALGLRAQQSGEGEKALAILKEGTTSGSALGDHNLTKQIDLLSQLHRPLEILVVCEKLVEEYPWSPFSSRALLVAGDVYREQSGQTNRAVEAYERILIQYGQSIEADEARDRLRALQQPAAPGGQPG